MAGRYPFEGILSYGEHDEQRSGTVAPRNSGWLSGGHGIDGHGGRDQRATSPTLTPSLSKTFVLVHGAWHGGWCWRRVADRLEGKGHKVFTPTMTGLCERSHLLTKDIDLATHITDIVNVLKWEDLKDIVLVGHSYGGIIISGVADQMARQDRVDRVPGRVRAGQWRQPDGKGFTSGARRHDGRDQERRDRHEADPGRGISCERKRPRLGRCQCTPQPINTLTDKAKVTGGREKIAKRAYIRAKGYPSVPFDAAYDKAQERRRLGHVRYAGRSRRDGRYARPAHRDPDRSGVGQLLERR